MSIVTFEQALEKNGEIGTVDEVYGSLVVASGLPSITPNELVLFEQGQTGMVFSLTQEGVEILILTQSQPIQVGTRAARSARPLTLKLSPSLLGKSVSALGTLWGSGSEIKGAKEERMIDQEPLPLMSRELVTQPFVTGVTMVDLVVPLGKGQRELVVGDHKIGKTSILLQSMIAHARRGGIVVYAGVAKRSTEVATLEQYIKTHEVDGQVVLVFSGSADTAGLIYLTPYTAMTMAEYFRDQKKDVLVVFDDLTIHAKFYREISLLARRYPGRSAYPGDIFSIHAKLMERAGNFANGSITALPVAETVMGNIAGYIQTNLMSMTDGHIYFDADLFNQAKRPAINPFLSVTRVGHQTQTSLLRQLSRELSNFLVNLTKLKELLHFGGELTDRVKRGLDKGELIEALFNQPDDLVVPLAVSGVLLAVVWNEMLSGPDAVAQIPEVRIRLIDAYGHDQGWRDYMDGLMGMDNLETMLTKVKTDSQMLNSLMGLKGS